MASIRDPLTRPAPAGTLGSSRDRPTAGRAVLALLAIAASGAAMAVLAGHDDGEVLDYGVGLVPLFIPWAASWLIVALALVGMTDRGACTRAGALLVGLVIGVTAWAITMLPFDILRIVGLVPLPLSTWGLLLRLLLLVGATLAVVPAIRAQRSSRARCAGCGRTVAGWLDRLPRWPVVAGLVASLAYPALRITWALGGTFGMAGGALVMDPALAWGVVVVGALLVAFIGFLLVDRGPAWSRALFGLGGLVPGMALTVMGGLAAIGSASMVVREGLDSAQGEGILTWVFVLVYGSWFVAGVGVLVGGWRYWAHRRDDCAACRAILGRQ